MRKIVLAPVVLFLSACAFSPSNRPEVVHTIKDKFGRVEGYISSDGMITDKVGRVEGYIRSDGSITDKYGRVKGYIE